MNRDGIIAHTSELSDETQTLEEHLMKVANKSKEGSIFPNTSYLIGILHDLGKSDPKWQVYIRNGEGMVNHTSSGAKWVELNIKGTKVYKDILKYVITAHHGYYDSIADDVETGKRVGVLEDRRLKYDVKDETYSYEDTEEYLTWLTNKHGIILEDLVDKSKAEFNGWITVESKSTRDYDVLMYRVGLKIRYLLSVLKDADINDTVTWDKTWKSEVTFDTESVWEGLDSRIEDVYEGFTSGTPINTERERMSNDVMSNGENISKGIVKLDMPTGTGKTLTSLRYAVRQAKKYNKKRIIYITPYLSVLEQNADVIKETINDDSIVLEHHSNIVTDSEFSESKLKEMLKVNWNSPIVLTTMVQFFNTCFKGRSSNIRRFKALENSVIIIDEIQSLPPDKISLINGVLNELALTYNSLIITCTATQPELDSQWVYEPINYDKTLKNGDLVEETPLSRELFTRTQDVLMLDGKMSTNELVDNIEEDLIEQKSVLVILDLKKAVNTVYEECKSRGLDVIYLTTNLCAEHRLDRIAGIRGRLDNGDAFVVISTQLIEAGVDVDFKVVYRNIIGLDRIIQARGRCNREGELDYGEMYVVDYEGEDLNFGAMRDLKVGQDVSSIVLKGNPGKRWDELIPIYYNILYKNKLKKKGTKGLLSGDLKATTIYDLLSTNKFMVNGKNTGIPQFFKTAYQEANLIEEGGMSVVVPYGNSSNYVEDLLKCHQYSDVRGARENLKKLQRFTVNYYKREDLEGKGVLYEDLGIFILYEDFYDSNKGIDVTKSQSTLIL